MLKLIVAAPCPASRFHQRLDEERRPWQRQHQNDRRIEIDRLRMVILVRHVTRKMMLHKKLVDKTPAVSSRSLVHTRSLTLQPPAERPKSGSTRRIAPATRVSTGSKHPQHQTESRFRPDLWRAATDPQTHKSRSKATASVFVVVSSCRRKNASDHVVVIVMTTSKLAARENTISPRQVAVTTTLQKPNPVLREVLSISRPTNQRPQSSTAHTPLDQDAPTTRSRQRL